MKARTDWFEPEIKPELPGVYETSFFPYRNQGWSRWDGELWSFQRNTMEAAHLSLGSTTAEQKKRWRGLAENPEPVVVWLPEEEVHDA